MTPQQSALPPMGAFFVVTGLTRTIPNRYFLPTGYTLPQWSVYIREHVAETEWNGIAGWSIVTQHCYHRDPFYRAQSTPPSRAKIIVWSTACLPRSEPSPPARSSRIHCPAAVPMYNLTLCSDSRQHLRHGLASLATGLTTDQYHTGASCHWGRHFRHVPPHPQPDRIVTVVNSLLYRAELTVDLGVAEF